MKSSYDVHLAASPDEVWERLTDLDAVVAALPGATLERDGDAVTGSVKTKLGAAQVTYRVTARADLGVSGRHVAVVVVTGREARGPGILAASLTLTVRPGESAATAHLAVNADIDATGRGEGADDEAWSKVITSLLDAVLPFAAVGLAAGTAETEQPETEQPETEAADTEPAAPAAQPAADPPTPASPAGPPWTADRPRYASPRPVPDRRADPRMIFALVGIVLLMLTWRRRRRR